MTLLETIRTIETVALQQAAVNTVVENDIFKLNDMPNVKYGVFAFTQGQHTSTTEGAFTTYGFTLFYVDRLSEDRSNQIQIQSTGERTLRNILLILADQGIESSQYTIQPFYQRFADECAGVYCEVSLSVPNDGTCPDWVPAIPPQNVITREEFEAALTRSAIRTDRYQNFTTEAQTRALANAGTNIVVLDELPNGAAVTAELSSQLAACSALVVKNSPHDGGSRLYRRVKSATVDGAQATTFEALADEQSIYLVTVRVDAEALTATSTVETVPIGEGASGSLPAGGTAGQVLTKMSDADADAGWADAAGGGLPFKVMTLDFNGTTDIVLSNEQNEEIAEASALVIKNSAYGTIPILMIRSGAYPQNFFNFSGGDNPWICAKRMSRNIMLVNLTEEETPYSLRSVAIEEHAPASEAAAEE